METIASDFRPTTMKINGLRFASNWDRKQIESRLSYTAKDDDIFLSSYQKSGSTWLRQIAYLIINYGIPPEHMDDMLKSFPILEYGSESVEKREKPGIIRTHLPFHLQPYNPKAKYIFIQRNPKDVIVSLYYHIICQPTYHYDADFHHFFQLWLEGEFVYEDYFEFINSWWNHHGESNFLFLFYEDLKRDTSGEILKLANFLGEEYMDKLCANNEECLNNILEYSSFDYMRNKQKGLSNRYVRKGIVGDWRSHFTEEESIQIDNLIRDNWSGTGLENYWINELKWN